MPGLCLTRISNGLKWDGKFGAGCWILDAGPFDFSFDSLDAARDKLAQDKARDGAREDARGLAAWVKLGAVATYSL